MLGTLPEYIDKAENDVRLSQELLQRSEHLDWCIVTLFYFTLHCVNGHAAQIDRSEFEKSKYKNDDDHTKRIKYARSIDRQFAKLYSKLYSKSRQCRYDPVYYKYIKKDTVQRLFDESKALCIKCRLFPGVRFKT